MITIAAVAFRATLIVGALTVASFQANAIGLRTKLACAGDYYKHCSQFSPSSPQTRQCMRRIGAGLSKGCVDALVADGEVSQAEVSRRRMQSQTAAR